MAVSFVPALGGHDQKRSRSACFFAKSMISWTWVAQAESPRRPGTRACYKDLRHSYPNHPTRSQPAAGIETTLCSVSNRFATV